VEIARDALAEMPEKEWGEAVERVRRFGKTLPSVPAKLDEKEWLEVNKEIAKLRKKVAG
jgi:hypothetical protein